MKQNNAKEKTKVSLIGSIKGKVLLMGILAIAAAVILGIAGLSALNKNTVNSEVLAKTNSINLLQYENQSLETSYLYFLEDSYLEKIISNLGEMEKNAQETLKLISGNTKAEMEKALANIIACRENYEQLRAVCSERGFVSGAGYFGEYVSSDAELMEEFRAVKGNSTWVDATWLDAFEKEDADDNGAHYVKINYNNYIPQVGKRDLLVTRIGGNGIVYDKPIYITDIVFSGASGKKEYDLSALTTEELNGSYGEAFKSVEMGKFQGNPAIKITGVYTGVNNSWEEIAIKIPVKSYDIHNYSDVSFSVYFGESYPEGVKVIGSVSDIYDFETNLNRLDGAITSYNKHVIEGTDVAEEATTITTLLDEITVNAKDYVYDEATESSIVGKLESKKSLFEKMKECDSKILGLKKENITITEEVATETQIIRDNTEADTNQTKSSLTVLIGAILAVSAIILIFITVIVSAGMNRSINKFQETLARISDGEIKVKAKTNNGNEFDTFGKSLNGMTDKLTKVIGDVIGYSAELNRSGAQLEHMSQSSRQTSEQVDMSVEGISQGAMAQASDIETSTNEISHLGELMDAMDSDIADLDDTSVNMKNASDEAVNILGELSDSNKNMTDGIRKISYQITKTNDSVKEIEEAVSLISSIADQTTLLSLNASIEAARAGEAGRGFAVVASEIQQLADQSNNSANTIFQVISNLINDFKETMLVMSEVENATTEQNEKLAQTQQQFEIVNDGIAQSRDKTAVIKNAIVECNNVRNNVTQLMMNLSAISEENAASTAETATAMQKLNTTMTELLEESQKLLSISTQLDEDMKFFKMDAE